MYLECGRTGRLTGWLWGKQRPPKRVFSKKALWGRQEQVPGCRTAFSPWVFFAPVTCVLCVLPRSKHIWGLPSYSRSEHSRKFLRGLLDGKKLTRRNSGFLCSSGTLWGPWYFYDTHSLCLRKKILVTVKCYNLKKSFDALVDILVIVLWGSNYF